MALHLTSDIMLSAWKFSTSFSGPLFSASLAREAVKRGPGNEVGKLCSL